MKGGAWLVLAVSMLMGLGLTIGAIASRRQMRTAVVVVLCLVGIGIGSDDHRDAARTPRLFERDAADTRNDRPRGPVAGLHRDPHRHRR